MRFRLALIALVAACSSSNNKNNDMVDAPPVDDGSCFDGRQDGDEQGIDCGGRCDTACVTAGCGNGIVEPGETCDDHNTMDGDGCDSNCKPTGCGNGVITGAELCDDGNTADGDGCSADCSAKEDGFDCTAGTTGQPATVCTAHCGDGIVVGNETCDDMNTDATDGCDACQLSAGCGSGETSVVLRNGTAMPIPDDDTVTGVSSTIDQTTGGAITKLAVLVNVTHPYDADVELHLVGPTGIAHLLSQDNGGSEANYSNTRFEDSATTLIDDGTAPFSGSFKPDEPLAGFIGTKAAGTWTLRAYDDSSGDEGSLDNWTLLACVNTTAGYCGDGTMDAGEECDDGNTVDTDACKNNCKLPCGDGVLDAGELCDDGNHADNDGCSSTCQFDCAVGSTLVTGMNATPVTIPMTDDGTAVDSIINLPTSGGVTKLWVKVDSITFEDTYEIDVSLIAPNGTQRLLSSEDDFNANFTNTLYDDAATTSIDDGSNPFTGSFRPKESLSTSAVFDNKTHQAKGDWKLHVVNTAGLYTGTIDKWTIAACVVTTGAYCGNGTKDAGEDCDDGDTNDTNACPNSCLFKCGNGLLDAGEACDDGNHTNNDGCSSTCQYDCPVGATLKTASNASMMTIPDGDDNGVSSPVTISGTTGNVSSVRATVNIAHTYDSDLILSLVGPGATPVTRVLSTHNGDNNDNYTNTVFTDTATTPIASGTSPFTGAFKPEQTLSTTMGTDFKGAAAAGTWNLHVVDDGAGITGSITNWTLAVCVGP